MFEPLKNVHVKNDIERRDRESIEPAAVKRVVIDDRETAADDAPPAPTAPTASPKKKKSAKRSR